MEAIARKQEQTCRWWLAAIVWTAVIYLTIPMARTIRDWVADTKYLGREMFSWAVLMILLGGGIWVGCYLYRHRGVARTQWIWLGVIAVVYGAWILHLRATVPEEAVHFVQYGILALLLFRAYGPIVGDGTVLVVIVLSGSCLGAVDEIIQWVVPRRVFDLRDIGLNAASCGLMSLGVGLGFRPPILSRAIKPSSFVRVWLWGTITCQILVFCLLNTGLAQADIEYRYPWLKHWLRHTKPMTEYGYFYRVPEVGTFKSRLSPEDLQAEDERRFAEAAGILNEYYSPESYKEFLQTYSEVTDPFLHEARVHLFRRDRYLNLAHKTRENDVLRSQFNSMVAYREHRIMQTWFGWTLAHSRFDLKPETLARLKQAQNLRAQYRSPVSQKMIVQWTQWQLLVGLAISWLVYSVGCMVFCRRVARRNRYSGSARTDPQMPGNCE